jgi:glycine/serine hydroxymethyltransferase
MTTRGMKETEATTLAEIMIATMRAKDDAVKKSELQQSVQQICEKFPVPEVMV